MEVTILMSTQFCNGLLGLFAHPSDQISFALLFQTPDVTSGNASELEVTSFQKSPSKFSFCLIAMIVETAQLTDCTVR